MKNVIIAGGGIIGLSCAYYLQKEGSAVTVIDDGHIADGCSFGNMGYISPSHFVPLATPGIMRQGIKWMMDASSPFYIRPRMNLDLVKWGLHFYRSANKRRLEQNIPHLNNLLQLSRELVSDLRADLGDRFHLSEKGCWMLYKKEATGDHEKHLADQANKLGLRTLDCKASEVQHYEKEVEVDVRGGVLYLDDCYVDPAKLMRVLHAYLEKNGARFILKESVTGFEKSGSTIKAVITEKQKLDAEEFVIANGAWLPLLARKLGISILLQPGKGYSFGYTDLSSNLLYPSILVDDRVATSPYGRSLRIGGTMELSGYREKRLPKRVLSIYHAFKKYYPGMKIDAPDPSTAWYGYRPVSPDGMPYIGRDTDYANLYFAGGHAMLGVSAATGTGKLLSQLIHRQPLSANTDAFNPRRFS